MLLLIANSEATGVPIEIRDILRCVISIDLGTGNRKIMQKVLIKEKAKKVFNYSKRTKSRIDCTQ